MGLTIISVFLVVIKKYTIGACGYCSLRETRGRPFSVHAIKEAMTVVSLANTPFDTLPVVDFNPGGDVFLDNLFMTAEQYPKYCVFTECVIEYGKVFFLHMRFLD